MTNTPLDDLHTRLPAYLRLCSRANPESVRRHPATSPYLMSFCAIAKQRGLVNARAWLLGRLLLDLHPPEDVAASVTPAA